MAPATNCSQGFARVLSNCGGYHLVDGGVLCSAKESALSITDLKLAKGCAPRIKVRPMTFVGSLGCVTPSIKLGVADTPAWLAMAMLLRTAPAYLPPDMHWLNIAASKPSACAWAFTGARAP